MTVTRARSAVGTVGTERHESEGPERFHGEQAADRREKAADMDPRGAGGEGFGETSPVERGAPNSVGAGESPVPGMSEPEAEDTGDRQQTWNATEGSLT